MKNVMNRILAATALLACFACAKTEMDIDKASSLSNEKGKVYGYIEPLSQNTRAYWENSANLPFQIEVGDKVNVWTPKGTHMEYNVSKLLEAGHFELDTEEFELKPGVTYTAGSPWLPNVTNSATAQVISYEGQTQTDQSGNQLRDLAKYLHLWAVSTCDANGNTSFKFKSIGTVIRAIITLPKEGMSISEVKLTADKPVFALNGTVDFTTGTFTATGALSESLTMTLDDVEVRGNVLKAFFGSAPLAAANYVISVTDNAGNVYKSEAIKQEARPAHSLTEFITDVAPVGGYLKLTSMPTDPAGKYILVYPNGTTYRAFSFTKAMGNAEAAGELAKDTHGLENILAMGSQLYATVVSNNCIDIEGPANAESLILTPDQEKEAAFDVSLQDEYHRWGSVDGKVKLTATTQKGNTYSIGIDHAVVNVNGNADVVVAFNAPDVINAMKAIRGTDLPVNFDYLINMAVAQAMKEGITFTPEQIARLKSGFVHLCELAKSMVASHPELFQGGTLMDIDLSTNVFDVIGRYYDNATQLSWAIAPQKRFGLATLGYHAYDKGFTFNVGLPQAGWFNRLEESLKYDADNDGVLEVEDCVAYWKQFDSQYNILGIQNFFERASRRALNELDPSTLVMLQQMAAAGKFAAIGNVYKKYADRFNDDLEPVYIYKKVQ